MALHPSIRIERGLLGPDLVDQLRAGELPGQRSADFAVRPPASSAETSGARGDRVREQRAGYGGKPRPRWTVTDEVARAFADARSLWSVFQHRREPFLALLDYELTYNRRAYELGGLTFAISHRAGTPEDAPPVHIVGVGHELGRGSATGRPGVWRMAGPR